MKLPAMNEPQDKACVVTGGAGSIGLESARLFLEEGTRLFLVDLDEEALSAAAGELPGDDVAWSVADVSKANDTRAYLDKAVATFGKIDVPFSNAGSAGAIAPIVDYPDDVFDRVQAVHVRGAYNACKYGLPCMNDGDSIIITSSVAAFRGDLGATAYITARIAQIGLMRCVAREAALRRIRVSTIPSRPNRQFLPGGSRVRSGRHSQARCDRDVQRADPARAPCQPARDSPIGVGPEQLHHRHDAQRHRRYGRLTIRLTSATPGQ
jgi:NAD(P)-dependent dehydrogenase (short-subunit alcohol dehydrogenase family)